MSETRRTFIAVSVPCGEKLRHLLGLLGQMGKPVKPVAADNLHLTLKFLGDTPAEQIPAVSEIVQTAASNASSFQMELVGIGAFPRKERPSVIWAGIDGGEPLVQIAEELEQRLQPLGFQKERRAFSPHLTLARVRRKPPPELFELFEQHAATRFGTVSVGSLTYYASDLRPQGAVYTSLSTGAMQSG